MSLGWWCTALHHMSQQPWHRLVSRQTQRVQYPCARLTVHHHHHQDARGQWDNHRLFSLLHPRCQSCDLTMEEHLLASNPSSSHHHHHHHHEQEAACSLDHAAPQTAAHLLHLQEQMVRPIADFVQSLQTQIAEAEQLMGEKYSKYGTTAAFLKSQDQCIYKQQLCLIICRHSRNCTGWAYSTSLFYKAPRAYASVSLPKSLLFYMSYDSNQQLLSLSSDLMIIFWIYQWLLWSVKYLKMAMPAKQTQKKRKDLEMTWQLYAIWIFFFLLRHINHINVVPKCIA